MSDERRSAASHRGSRAWGCAALAVVTAFLPVATADSAPLTASAEMRSSPSASPPKTIRAATSSFDPQTGVWSTTVTFAAPQTDQSAEDLKISLGLLGPAGTVATWDARTSPTAPNFHYSGPYVKDGPQGAATSAGAFDEDRRSITLLVTDPRFVGQTPAVFTAGLEDDASGESGTTFDSGQGTFDVPAPTPVIPASARTLTFEARGRVTIPLAPLPYPASRLIIVSDAAGHRLVRADVPAERWRATSITARVLVPSRLRHLSDRTQAGTLRVLARTTGTNQVAARRAVRLRTTPAQHRHRAGDASTP